MGNYMLRISCSPMEHQTIIEGTNPVERGRILYENALGSSPTVWGRFTEGLSPQNERLLVIAPAHIGGDSIDMEHFVCTVLRVPVTDENYIDIARAFRAWYKVVAPSEYHAPASLSVWSEPHEEQ